MARWPTVDEGFLRHRGFRVWYGVEGDRDEPGRLPVLTVHGGPGICHDCLEPLADLARAGRRVVFYDQLGCGNSDRPDDTSVYDIPYFTDELEAVARELGLERFHLYAHSYGGAIALEYLTSRPHGAVASLVISNSFASVPDLAAGWARLRSELPEEVREAFAHAEATGATDSPEYGAALGAFVAKHVLPVPPPESLIRSQQKSGAEVYAAMHGRSWFQPDGAYAHWDVTDRLGSVDVPTLVIGGRSDQCVPELAEAIHRGIPGSQLEILDTAHLPFIEQPDAYLALIGDFLERVETATLD